MKHITDVLLEVKQYIDMNRGVGHTHTLKNGTDRSEGCFLLAHTHQAGVQIAERNANVKVISINSLYRLRGGRLPLAIDNAALSEILGEALKEISVLQEQVQEERDMRAAGR